MKIIIVSFILFVFSCGYSLAGDCKILDFMKKGVKVELWMAMGPERAVIAEVDESKCYFKGEDGYWYNINMIVAIKSL